MDPGPATLEDILQRNKEYAVENHKPFPYFSEIDKPKDGVLVVTCLDFRVRPHQFLKVGEKDPVVYMTNVCGHIEPILGHILAVDTFVRFGKLLIIHHTDCGALHLTDAGIKTELKLRAPGHEAEAEKFDTGVITDLEQSVRDDVATFKSSPFVRKELADNTTGLIYDIKTGLLSVVSEK